MSGQVLAFGLGKDFDGRTALDSVDVALDGGLTAVLGPNGAGKSTLLRCLATVLEPDRGSLLIDGLDPVHEADRIEIRRRLGYLPQSHGLIGPNRVFDTLDYLAVLKDVTDERHRRHMVFDALERVGLAHRASDPLDALSGGMRQRIGLAQALLAAPALLVLDEPAAGLDPDERFRMREILAERRHRSTVVVSTHLTEEAAYCDTVIVLADGSVRFVGPPERLAATAAGRAWKQSEPPPASARASWLEADGRHRCLGDPPPDAELVAPTLEDGYLLLVPRSVYV
jgi:ABC-type multidrug transport system ATPase subunit